MSKSWRETQKQKLREAIYETSLRLFRGQGFEQTTIGQIAAEVGVAKGTFFNYFKNKEEILNEWYCRITREAIAEVRGTEYATAEEAFCALAVALARRTEMDARLWDHKTLQSSAKTLFLGEEGKLDQELAEVCSRWLNAAHNSGELNPNLDTKFFIDLFVAVLTGTGHNWVVVDHAFNLSGTLKQRIVFLFRAARSQER